LQAKRKASEKLEKLNQAKEEIEAIQREIDEMKEQEKQFTLARITTSQLWTKQKNPERNFFRGKWNFTVRGF
jgi:FtsZ-binding cell division protein ZapB